MLKKVRNLLNSIAGRVGCVLSVISITFIIVVCSNISAEFFAEEMAESINNILIGIATNLIGIVITVSIIQSILDKQDEKKAYLEEKDKILRYDIIMQLLIQRYFMLLYAVITPLEKRGEVSLEEVTKRDIKFEDMRDLYKSSPYLTDGILEPSIVLFYNAEEQLRNHMMTMINNIDFKYHPEIASLYMKFINDSIAYDTRGTIKGNINVLLGNGKMSEKIMKDIAADSTYKWVERFDKGELESNMMVPYIILYKLILSEREMTIEYQRMVDKLKSE
ncbi:hypothetical protein [Butyrivibrio sp. XPD2006]|uniref:hypothetical protein n=1 Tax=Butyrivibrio sp. XPD2006 TaxID=1280668 RepID=UPI0003B4FCB6|nr:hypothetical protein [Butyrivibrio sp. XPD2006]